MAHVCVVDKRARVRCAARTVVIEQKDIYAQAPVVEVPKLVCVVDLCRLELVR